MKQRIYRSLVLLFAVMSLLFVLGACADDGAAQPSVTEASIPVQTEQAAEPQITEPPTTEQQLPDDSAASETSVVIDLAVTLEPQTTAAPTEQPETDTPPEVPSAEPIDPAVYFEGSLFVGDSILEGLAQYVRAQRQTGADMLSDAKFLTSIMGVRVADLVGDTASYERIRYQYRGAVRELSEIVSLAAPKRLFLLLGMNDLAGGASVDETAARYDRLLTALQSEFPSLEIVVMTPTPKTASAWLPDYCTNPDFGSPLLRTFADRLLALCETHDVPCIDVFAALADDSGNLPDAFSRDNYVHINDLGSAVVVEALNRFAKGESPS